MNYHGKGSEKYIYRLKCYEAHFNAETIVRCCIFD